MTVESLVHRRRLPARLVDSCLRCDDKVLPGQIIDVWADPSGSVVTHVGCAPSDGVDGPRCPDCLRRMEMPRAGWNRSFTRRRWGAPRCGHCQGGLS